MDRIVNAVSDMCVPQIIPDVTFQTIEEKCIVQIEIYPGQNRPYYIRSMGKENGTYIRAAGTSRPVDEAILKDLEYQGAGKSYDEIVNVEIDYDEKQALRLCNDIRRYIAESRELPISKVRKITVTNLENWGILKKAVETIFLQMPLYCVQITLFGLLKYNVHCLREKTERYSLTGGNLPDQSMTRLKKHIGSY